MSARLRAGFSMLMVLDVAFVMAALWFSSGLDTLPDRTDDGHGHLLGFNRPFTWGHTLLAFAQGSFQFDKLTVFEAIFLLMHLAGLIIIWLPDSLGVLRRAFLMLQLIFVPFALIGALLWISFVSTCVMGNMDVEGFEITPLNSIGASVLWVAIWLFVWRRDGSVQIESSVPLNLISNPLS